SDWSSDVCSSDLAWCGTESGRGQDPADCPLTDAMAQAAELSLDAPVPPPRVLPGQPLDKLADLVRDRRASRSARIGPFARGQAPVPGEQGAWRHDPMRLTASGQHPRQRGDHGAAGPVRLRAGDLT